MEMFFASLWPLVEGWRCLTPALIPVDPTVARLLADKHRVQALKDFRDAVWHFREQDLPQIAAMGLDHGLRSWSMDLSAAFLDFTAGLPGVVTNSYREGPKAPPAAGP